MSNRDSKEKTFAEQLAQEVTQNKDAIVKLLNRSRVGNCGGKCKGWKENDLRNLCPACFRALEEESDEIFSTSPALRLFGDVMNTKD
ncbi:MAG: hypothetical protein ACLQF0_03315 [Dissulfurispiraceae bacterium]